MFWLCTRTRTDVLACTMRRGVKNPRNLPSHAHSNGQGKRIKKSTIVRLQEIHQVLEDLRRRFNALPEYRTEYESVSTPKLRAIMVGPSDYEVWKVAERILIKCKNMSAREALPSSVVRQFNALAERAPFTFIIQQRQEKGARQTLLAFAPQMRSRWNVYRATQLLWAVLQHPGRARLKRCPACKQWFVDSVKNSTKQYCSTGCKWKWWDRERRREAGHQHQRKGTTRKKA